MAGSDPAGSWRSSCLSLLLSCSEGIDLKRNNDPTQYRVVRDVLWASPGEFHLTMDIYTPEGGKAHYPVIVLFHGGGWLVNDKSIRSSKMCSVRCFG